MQEDGILRRQSEYSHEMACSIIREAIARMRWAILGEPPTKESDEWRQPEASGFAGDVRDWLAAVRMVSEKGWDSNEVWHFAFRQHLALVVGPKARTELGRWASQCGYRMLAVEFRVLFGRPIPHERTVVCGDCSGHQELEEGLVAFFCALPLHVRQDPCLVERLLQVVTRIVARNPQRLSDVAGESLAEMARLPRTRVSREDGERTHPG